MRCAALNIRGRALSQKPRNYRERKVRQILERKITAWTITVILYSQNHWTMVETCSGTDLFDIKF